MAPRGFGCAAQGRQIRDAILVDGGGNGDDDQPAVAKRLGIVRVNDRGGGHLLIGDLQGAVFPDKSSAILLDFIIVAHHIEMPREMNGQGQPDIAQAHHRNLLLFCRQRLKGHHLPFLLAIDPF
jgi:hypothetical protein